MRQLKDFTISYLDYNQDSKPSEIYVLENEITDSLIKEFKYKDFNVSIIIVNNKELLQGNIQSIINILPLKQVDKNLVIDVVHFGVEIKRRKIKLINSLSGIGYNLKYDCSKEKYFVERISDGE